jgi:rare lipoprotein A
MSSLGFKQSTSWAPLLVLLFMAQSCAMIPGQNTMVNVISRPPLDTEKQKPEIVPTVTKKPPPSSIVKVHTGEASWYGQAFQGKKTASGEIFDQTKFTAAHRTFPLGSRAKVTRLENGKSVEVEINDRGPYSDGRIIDLSRAAARELGIVEDGTATVRVELISEPSPNGTR